MDITITPGKLNGEIRAVPSKSHAHRLMICAAFADAPTDIICHQTSQDVAATIHCLNALGANIVQTDWGYRVFPIVNQPSKTSLDCRESGSTLRFLLPIVGALGIETTFSMQGSLSSRPLSPLWEEMEHHGCTLTRLSKNEIMCTGKLLPGNYVISGAVSSQFISGLLFAMALMDGNSHLTVLERLESKPYLVLTQQVLKLYGIETNGFSVAGGRRFSSPRKVTVEGDWSNAAFFLAAQQLGSTVTITGLDANSQQGDKLLAEIARKMRSPCTIDVADTPDLFPILAIVAGALRGAQFVSISRLHYKESDRVASVITMLEKLGCTVVAAENSMTVEPATYRSCTIDSYHDHRIAMAAAIAATVATGNVTIRDAECVAKSYPSFWEDYRKLGGNYEQHL